MVAIVPLGVLVAALLVYGVVVFNRLVKQRNSLADAWAGIDVQLTRRADLVPNLVEAVKGYKLHEQETLEHAAAARTSIRGATATADAEGKGRNAAGSLLAVAGAYPALKATTTFQHRQPQLSTPAPA